MQVFLFYWISHRNAFKHELTLLEKVRHPNVVQFVGAVTQNLPMMIVSEYHPKVWIYFLTLYFILMKIISSCSIASISLHILFIYDEWWLVFISTYSLFHVHFIFQGDLGCYLQKKGRLSPSKALRFALDVARQVLFFSYRNFSICNCMLLISFIKPHIDLILCRSLNLWQFMWASNGFLIIKHFDILYVCNL